MARTRTPRSPEASRGEKPVTRLQLFRNGSALAGALVLVAPGLAVAQTDAADAAHTIDEIVVTAQKREQSLQDVPIVVTSVSGQQIQDAGVRDIKDLTIVAPGLTVTSTS